MKQLGHLTIDRVGAFASAVCAVHCLLSGLALGLLSVFGLGFIGSSTTDIVLISITLSVASIAIFAGIRRHHSLVPAGFFLCGVFAILMSHVVLDHESKDIAVRIATTTFAVLGGVFLVTFHVVNLRLLRRCQH